MFENGLHHIYILLLLTKFIYIKSFFINTTITYDVSVDIFGDKGFLSFQ